MTEPRNPLLSTAAQVLSTFVHVRPDGCLQPMPVTDAFWQQLADGQLAELDQGYLLSAFQFSADWPTWERHPAGDEWVFLLQGEATLILELADGPRALPLTQAGEFAVVPRGVWHTAQTTQPTTLLFLTPGAGTEHRPCQS